ncbi:MAG: hypothetical protein VYA51_12965 [Planctomycetota bacterium]|nr:hypothetical protein [Planctomycetota bacterium]
MLTPEQRCSDVRVYVHFTVDGIAGVDYVIFRPALEDLHARAKREAAELLECEPEEIVILGWRLVTRADRRAR